MKETFEKAKPFLIYLCVFVLVWVGLDFLFSLMRAMVFVLTKAVKTALYAGVISYAIFKIMEKTKK